MMGRERRRWVDGTRGAARKGTRAPGSMVGSASYRDSAQLLGGDAETVLKPEARRVRLLRRPGSNRLRPLARGLPKLSRRHGRASRWNDARPIPRSGGELRTGELPLGDAEAADAKSGAHGFSLRGRVALCPGTRDQRGEHLQLSRPPLLQAVQSREAPAEAGRASRNLLRVGRRPKMGPLEIEPKSFELKWWPQRDSNPCRGL